MNRRNGGCATLILFGAVGLFLMPVADAVPARSQAVGAGGCGPAGAARGGAGGGGAHQDDIRLAAGERAGHLVIGAAGGPAVAQVDEQRAGGAELALPLDLLIEAATVETGRAHTGDQRHYREQDADCFAHGSPLRRRAACAPSAVQLFTSQPFPTSSDCNAICR